MGKKDEVSYQVNLVNYSDEDLINAKNNLDIEYGKYAELWAQEVAYLVNEKNVDPYSFWGERKIKKVNTKYADKTSDIQLAIEMIDRELAKRDKYNFEQSFIGSKKYYDDTLTEEEFFEKEELKTMKYKKSIDDQE